MFLNYIIGGEFRHYTGVDVSSLFYIYSSSVKDVIYKWERTLMGLLSSPFIFTQTFGWNEYAVFGDHLDLANNLGLDKVVFNLPGY